MSLHTRPLILAVLTLGACSTGGGYEGQIDSLRGAVIDHTGAVQQASSTEQVRTETGHYVDATSGRMQRMMQSTASCPMMRLDQMQRLMDTLGAALTHHREAMGRLQDLGAMTTEATQHASGMMQGIDGIEAQYRACDCDHMM